MPHVLVQFADVHEDAHLRNRLKLGGAGLPHVSGEGGDGQEVLRIGGRDVKCGDPSVRRSGDVKLVVLDFVVSQNHFQKFREDARAVLEEQLIVGSGGSDYDIATLLRFRAEIATQDAV